MIRAWISNFFISFYLDLSLTLSIYIVQCNDNMDRFASIDHASQPLCIYSISDSFISLAHRRRARLSAGGTDHPTCGCAAGSDELVLDRVGVLTQSHRTNSMGGPGIDTVISNSTRVSAVAWAKWELFQETSEQ
jgi:hypothetical protein